jgi:hypothetical protein
MRSREFQSIPKVLETPKKEDLKEDVANMKVLRGLARSRKAANLTGSDTDSF